MNLEEFPGFKKILKNLPNLVNIANNCEIFEYICRTAETVSEFGREAFEKEENSSLVSKIHIEACWSCLSKE